MQVNIQLQIKLIVEEYKTANSAVAGRSSTATEDDSPISPANPHDGGTMEEGPVFEAEASRSEDLMRADTVSTETNHSDPTNADSYDIGIDADSHGLGTDADSRDLGTDADSRGLGTDADSRGLGTDADSRRLGTDADSRDLGTGDGSTIDEPHADVHTMLVRDGQRDTIVTPQSKMIPLSPRVEL